FHVAGVQTCALPISRGTRTARADRGARRGSGRRNLPGDHVRGTRFLTRTTCSGNLSRASSRDAKLPESRAVRQSVPFAPPCMRRYRLGSYLPASCTVPKELRMHAAADQDHPMTHTVPKTARLTYGDTEIELPVIVGSEGEAAIDIRQLRAKTGLITYDPGLGNTGSCMSKITFLDGERGVLRYAGYAIEELAERSNFLEVAWLLIRGELPTQTELNEFRREITYHTMIHEDLKRFFSAMPKLGHP